MYSSLFGGLVLHLGTKVGLSRGSANIFSSLK